MSRSCIVHALYKLSIYTKEFTRRTSEHYVESSVLHRLCQLNHSILTINSA